MSNIISPNLYAHAIEVAKHALENRDQVAEMARSVYNAMPSFGLRSGGMRRYIRRRLPRPIPRRRRFYKVRRPVRRRKPLRRRVLKKTARIARRYTGRVKKNNVYNRRKKNMRLYNKGALSLQQRLQNGGQLPQQTFARMFWRGSNTCYFSVASSGTPSNTTINNVL